MQPRIAYFSMEIALESDIPTYSGGLGVLAGDTLRSFADLGLPVVAVTLAHRKGYFRQAFGADGAQRELPDEWRPEDRLDAQEPVVTLSLGGETCRVRAWRYTITGHGGHGVPVYLLDTHLPENPESCRRLTDHLYGGGDRTRLAQEAVLGIGGARMLRALGHTGIERFHLNEGHAALAISELVEAAVSDGTDDVAAVAKDVATRCVFTTHTPVPAGHDRFPGRVAREVLGDAGWERLVALGAGDDLNMTHLALAHARFVNGVAIRHAEVSREMFPGYRIRAITNGIHPATWAAPPFAALFDEHIERWREDPGTLRRAAMLDRAPIAAAHEAAKADLVTAVQQLSGQRFTTDALTLGFGRRATAYKRPLLVLQDLERLAQIARDTGPIQIVFGGKAHPNDAEGRRLLQQVHQQGAKLPSGVSLALLPGYDMALCRTIVAGCDVWLNTPVPPLEASGTSGMKAALNGVPSLSVLDGWWVEGCVEGVTGWAIGRDEGADRSQAGDARTRDARHAGLLYDKLGDVVAPLYRERPEAFQDVMRQAIALNASYFNTHRMACEYQAEAYADAGAPARGAARS